MLISDSLLQFHSSSIFFSSQNHSDVKTRLGKARRAIKEDRPLLDLLVESEEVKLPKEELERLCDPANYLGLSAEMVDKVLKSVEA